MTIRLAPETWATIRLAASDADPGRKRAAAAAALNAALLRMPPGRGPFYATIELLDAGGRVVASGKQRVTKRGDPVGKTPRLRPTVDEPMVGVRVRMPSGETLTQTVVWNGVSAVRFGRLRLEV